ncbi:DUF6801 domain-containing protein [Streptomyces sp. KLOTTS4A1]|uniref:DUF6801 domain-containing protein n=1 Tax=Streptomyces sp. KLOTTS4A1 TaxID=3390996 RepID=UPI0039F61B6A
MSGRRTAHRRSTRISARTAATAAFVVLSAMVPGTGTAADAQQGVEADLVYRCAFPSGQRPVTVSVAARLPSRADVGEAVEAADVMTTIELPEEEVTAWAAEGAASARADTRLTVNYAQAAESAQAQWRGTAEETALPGSGAMEIVATGNVPTVTAGSTGELSLSAGELGFDLVMKTAEGEATAQETVSVSCTPAPDGDGRFAAIPIGKDVDDPGEASASPTASEDESPQPEERPRSRAPEVREPAQGTAADPEAPPCHYEDAPSVGLVTYITGYSNVRKLGNASLLPLSCVNVDQDPIPDIEFRDGVLHIIQNSTGVLDEANRPRTTPGPATLLTFGFMPTSAKMVLEQTGPMTIDSDLANTFPRTKGTTYIRVGLTLRLYDVKVNGVPLPVGDDCRTDGSLYSEEPSPEQFPDPHLVLVGTGTTNISGGEAEGYFLLDGGQLTGTFTIPRFTNCGIDEDLDSLLTASLSGPGNYVKQVQGPPCGVAVGTDRFCTDDLQPKVIPVPER